MTATSDATLDATFDASRARRATGALGDFNRAGILTAADVHVASRLGAIAGEADDAVLLAVALVVRSTRHGSVVVDLATAQATTSPDVDEQDETPAQRAAVTWPGAGWVARCAASPLLMGIAGGTGGTGGAGTAPIRMDGSRLWLSRYWEQEEQVAQELRERTRTRPADLDLDVLARGLERLFVPGADDDQRLAAAACALARVAVLAGGPGTGKTTTVARLLALLREQHPDCRIALAAPTGKAAARLEEAVRSASATMPAQDRARLGDLSATTLHRLLGWRPDARSRFRHDATDRLAYEIVVVDESSMVSLTMMARLLEALRPAARLVLVGDPDQLASVEAGAVLGDLVDPDMLGSRTPELAQTLRALMPGVGVAIVERPQTPTARVRDGVSALTTNRRFQAGGAIARLAAAIQRGRAEEALSILVSGPAELEFVEVADDARPSPDQLTGVRSDVQVWGADLLAAAGRGDAAGALAALERHRVLCAHRRGPRGVQHWSATAAAWVAQAHQLEPRADGHYAGEPLLVTTNDYDVGLYNGDTGVVVDAGGAGLVAAFGRGGAPILVPLVRLGAVRPMHAMTVHRSQGSQFDRVSVLLAPAASPLGTRQTLYTAVTRARERVRLIGSAAAFLAAVDRPAARASGLRERLRS